MRRLRPLKPAEKGALVVLFILLVSAVARSVARNWFVADAWKGELTLAAIALLLFAGVVYGLKSGVIGDRS